MKLNRKAKNELTKTTSFEGATAYVQKPEVELVRLVLTSMFGEDSFYESGDDKSNRLSSLVDSCVKTNKEEFVAKLAVYARNKMYMRTISIALIVELAKSLRKYNKTLPTLRSAVCKTISRADELAEIYSYALTIFGSKNSVPQAIKKGTADAFNKFDEYQLAKYNRSNVVKLKDVLKITHPTPKDNKQSKIFNRLLTDSLKTPDTWETKISTKGSTKENWQEVADNPKTGFMALLRNLNNFLNHNIDLTNVIKRLSSHEEVKKSKQFPYAFYSAIKAVKSTNPYLTPKLLVALETALENSVDNIPNIGNVVSIIDVSASMGSTVSNKSKISCAEIAIVMGCATVISAIKHGNSGFISLFATDSVSGKIDKNLSLGKLIDDCYRVFDSGKLGGGTNLISAYKNLQGRVFNIDSVLVFTDMQISSFSTNYFYYDDNNYSNLKVEEYINLSNDASKIVFDLRGYSPNTLTEYQGWMQLSGYSDKLFTFLKNKNSLSIIKDINKITL